MTWFKVDDSFHSHPKVLAADPAALGLWVVAGAWCSANLTDGFVPDYALPRLIPNAEPLAKSLVSAGLWKRSKGGYRFHDWGDYNPTSESVKEERAAARERMRTMRAARKKTGQRSGNVRTETGEANHESAGRDQKRSGEHIPNTDDPPVERSSASPTRPDPTRIGETSVRGSRSVTRADDTAPPGTPGPAERLIGGWLDACPKNPPSTVVDQIGRHVAGMVRDGIDPADIADGLRIWQRRGLAPSVLPAVVNQLMNAEPDQPSNVVALRPDRRPSTTDTRVGDALALAAELRAEAEAEGL